MVEPADTFERQAKISEPARQWLAGTLGEAVSWRLLEKAKNILQLEVVVEVSWTGIGVRRRIDLQLVAAVEKRTARDIDHLHVPMPLVGPWVRGDPSDKLIVQPDFGSIRTREAPHHEYQERVPVLVAASGWEGLLPNGLAISYVDSRSNTMYPLKIAENSRFVSSTDLRSGGAAVGAATGSPATPGQQGDRRLLRHLLDRHKGSSAAVNALWPGPVDLRGLNL